MARDDRPTTDGMGDDAAGWWPLLASLPADARDALVAAGRRASYPRGQTIIAHRAVAPPVHLVVRGRIGIEVTTTAGLAGLLDVLGPGACVGETTLEAAVNSAGRAVALDTTETIPVPRERFDQARRSSPAFDAEIVERGARWSEHLVALVLEAWFSPADTRVLRRLADVASRTATAAEAGAGAGGPASDRTVTVRITQDELAMLSGCSRPTVNRALAGAAPGRAPHLGARLDHHLPSPPTPGPCRHGMSPLPNAVGARRGGRSWLFIEWEVRSPAAEPPHAI